MTKTTLLLVALTAVAAAPTPGRAADEMYVYPAKGQSASKQDSDKQECHDWAVKQTGVDPEKLAAPTPEQSEGGATGKGMMGGAGLGAIRGAGGGEAGAMAGRGMATGGVFGAIRARRQMQQAHDEHMQQYEAQETQLQKYDRAYGACLTGRGYTVQ